MSIVKIKKSPRTRISQLSLSVLRGLYLYRVKQKQYKHKHLIR